GCGRVRVAELVGARTGHADEVAPGAPQRDSVTRQQAAHVELERVARHERRARRVAFERGAPAGGNAAEKHAERDRKRRRPRARPGRAAGARALPRNASLSPLRARTDVHSDSPGRAPTAGRRAAERTRARGRRTPWTYGAVPRRNSEALRGVPPRAAAKIIGE